MSFSTAFTSFKSSRFTARCTEYGTILRAKSQKNSIDPDESPFFFASVSTDNSTSTVGVVGTTAAAAAGAVVLSEGGECNSIVI